MDVLRPVVVDTNMQLGGLSDMQKMVVRDVLIIGGKVQDVVLEDVRHVSIMIYYCTIT